MNVTEQPRILTALLIALLCCAACTKAPEGPPGVTDKAIRLGMTADLSGPIAFIGQEVSEGANMHFRQVNEEGGVHGRSIELLVEDDGYQPPRTVAAYRKLVDRDHVFAFVGTVGTATTMALKPIAERGKVPIAPAVTLSSTIYTPPSRYLFGVDPSYRMTSWIFLDYIASTLKDKNARVGVIYQDDDMGADGLAGVREAADYYGLPIVAEEGHKRGAVDFSTQVLNVKKAGATHVILWTVLRETASILKEAKDLGWAPKFYSWPALADLRLVELAGDAAANVEVVNIVDLESDDPQVRSYRDAVEHFDPGRRASFYHCLGFAAAQLFVEALQRAGRDLTREKLVDALETLDHWDENALGLPFTYTDGRRGGLAARTFFSRFDVEHKKLVRVTVDAIFETPAD